MSGNFPTPRTNRYADVRPGTLVGRSRIETRIGTGASGAVFRAHEEAVGRTVALKVLNPGPTWGNNYKQRFLQDTRTASALGHPHIVPIYGAGDDAGLLHLTMRYVPSGDLRALMHSHGPLSPDVAMGLLAPLASALDAAHRAGIVHCAVKPTNVLVEPAPDGTLHPYLTDFGLGPHADRPGPAATALFRGTAAYAAPEQLNGRRATPATDQYALACIAHELLTGTPPFPGEDASAQLAARLSGRTRVSRLRHDLPSAVDKVVSRAMAWEPADRHPSCAAFVAALGRVLGGRAWQITEFHLGGEMHHPVAEVGPQRGRGRPGRAPQQGLGGQPGQAPRRRRLRLSTAILLALSVAVVTGIGAVALTWLRGGPGGQAPAAQAAATGSAHLAHVLHVPNDREVSAIGFGSDDTLVALDEAGSLTTFSTVGWARAKYVRLKTHGVSVRPQDGRFSTTDQVVVVPQAGCGGGATIGCSYGVYSTVTGRSQQSMAAGTHTTFGVGGPLLAVVDPEHEGVDTWTVAAHEVLDTDLGTDRLAGRRTVSAALAPSGKQLASGVESHGQGSVLWFTGVAGGDPTLAATIPTTVVATRIAVAGQTLAGGDGHRTDVYRAVRNRPVKRKHALLDGSLLALSPANGDLVATLDPSGQRISVWDDSAMLPHRWRKREQTDETVPLQRSATMTCAHGSPTTAAFGPDGRTLAVGCSDGTIDAWSL